MKDHVFYEKYDEQWWMVYCRETTGRFSTKMWYDGTCPKQECPCCHKPVRRENKRRKQ